MGSDGGVLQAEARVRLTGRCGARGRSGARGRRCLAGPHTVGRPLRCACSRSPKSALPDTACHVPALCLLGEGLRLPLIAGLIRENTESTISIEVLTVEYEVATIRATSQRPLPPCPTCLPPLPCSAF